MGEGVRAAVDEHLVCMPGGMDYGLSGGREIRQINTSAILHDFMAQQWDS